MSVIGLSDDVALVGGADDIEDIDRIQPPSDEVFIAQPDGELRRRGRRSQVNVPCAAHARHRGGDVPRHAVELIEVVAINIGGDRRGIARESSSTRSVRNGFKEKLRPGKP